jgi:hypothetical protein
MQMTTETGPARALMPAAGYPQAGKGSNIVKPQWTAPECTRLTAEYEHLKRVYGVAVERLFAIGYQATDAGYKRLRMATEDARIDLEAARLELEKHERTQPSAQFHPIVSRA